MKRANGAFRAEVEAVAADSSDGPCVVPEGINGRPVIRLNGKLMWASRAVWILAHGDPGELHVLHDCGRGVQGCIRLAHLYLGTPATNSKDMVRHGNSARGQRNHAAKLTALDVQEIRRLLQLGVAHRTIAARFGVGKSAVTDIASGKTWGWLRDEEAAA